MARRHLWAKLFTNRSSCFRVRTSWTSTLPTDFVEIFDTKEPGEIQVLHPNGAQSFIQWGMSKDTNFNRHLMEFVSCYVGANCRQSLNEPGGMCAIGRNPAHHLISESKFFKEKSSQFGSIVSKHVEKHYPMVYRELKSRHEDEWEGFPTKRVIISKNLMNSAHLDINDTTISWATFVGCSKTDSEYRLLPADDGWDFLFPQLTREGTKAIALRIHNYTTIVWDGKVQMHQTVLEKRLTQDLERVDGTVEGYYSLFLGGSK